MHDATRWCRRCALVAVVLCFSKLACHANGVASQSGRATTMECHSDDEKIVCHVILDRKASASDWKLERCMEDNDVCLEATFSQTLNNVRHDDKLKRDSLAEAFRKRMAIQHERESSLESFPHKKQSPITVGPRKYEPPFSQYRPEVARALEDISRQLARDASDLDLAQAYTSLALAHRGEAEYQPRSLPAQRLDLSERDADGAISALQEALVLYERVLPSVHGLGRDNVVMSIAIASSVLADTYQIHPSGQNMERALSYFRQSESSFQEVLQEGASRLDSLTFTEMELRWADSASRAAVLLIEKVQKVPIEGDMAWTSEVNDVDLVLISVEEGHAMLMAAIEVYRRAVKRYEKYPQQKAEHMYMIANNLYNAGSASVLLARSEDAIPLWEESLELYEGLGSEGDSIQSEYAPLEADLMYSLSDVYLQMGMYDETNDKYGKAMKLFAQHGAPQTILSASALGGFGTDEVLRAHEHSLREYHESLYDGQEVHIPGDYRDSGEPFYEPDDLYEAELQSMIGALKLARNDNEDALEHFNRALEFYADNIEQERTVADIKLNMAVLYMNMEEYEKSNKLRKEAVEIYRVVVEEGKNPLVDEELFAELMPSVPQKKKEEASEEDHSKDSIHERLIDIDEYRRGLINMTASLNDEL